MAERVVPGLTAEQIVQNAQRPKDVPQDRWNTGLAVIRAIMEVGVPQKVIENSYVGPNIPNVYEIPDTEVIIEDMPHWPYTTVDNGTTRETVLFTTLVPSEDPAKPFATEALPEEEVVGRVKAAIARAVANKYLAHPSHTKKLL
jgi:hypothetical protein